MSKSVLSQGRRRWVVALLSVLLVITFAMNAGRILVVDDPRPADMILVLAGETDHRPARALELLHQGYGHSVLIDVPADVKIYDVAQLDLAEKYVRSLPDSASVHLCPVHGFSTREETLDVRKCLAGQDGTRILIVTSDFHTRRALSIFRHQFRDKSFSIAASHEPTEFGTRWWTHRQWAKTCTSEWVRTIWWNIIERWY